MSKQKYTLLVFAIIGILLISPGIGVEFYDKVWSFPGNLLSDEFKSAFPIASIPLMVIALLGTGVYMTFKLGFPQLKHVLHGIRVTRGDYDDVEDEGDLNHFKALSTALAATVGIGNIAGVAIAIYYGGPGALFWMWITAFFGTALKYSECTLALQYRETDEFGNTAGGPMYTIENGLGPQWRWLAVTFAAFAVICSFFTGNAIQSFTLTDQLYSQFLPILGSNHPIMVKSVIIPGILEPSIIQVILGVILAFIVGSVILGGIKRIGNVTGYLVPIMATIYVFTALFIVLSNFEKIGSSFNTIFSMAFNPPAQISGIGAGAIIAFLNTMMMGVKRGLFSSEAGQGSAAIAHSTAKTKYSVREGVVALLEPYIDTIIICTLTGLVIMVTDSWYFTEFYSTRIDPSISEEMWMNSSVLTSYAFAQGVPYGDKIVTLAVVLFAISTAISWSFYGERATDYLFGSNAIKYYRYFYVFMVFFGSTLLLEPVWIFGDAALGFMTFPNLIAIILLSTKLKDISTSYFEKY
jgi:AGCS family alanine or glycine:cation symporter|tara:strand:- start:906 stop:2474 length:1569 start_codon:yes stop_codon:yes gene_type:complete